MKDIYLTDASYLAALKRLRDLIATGLKLESDDDDTPGCKHTECSWGLCNHSREAWPDREDLLFGRSPKYRQGHQCCPLSRNQTESTGCFYSCRIFKGHKISRSDAVKLYNEVIKSFEARIGTVCASEKKDVDTASRPI